MVFGILVSQGGADCKCGVCEAHLVPVCTDLALYGALYGYGAGFGWWGSLSSIMNFLRWLLPTLVLSLRGRPGVAVRGPHLTPVCSDLAPYGAL